MTIEYVLSPTKQMLTQIQELIDICANYEPITFSKGREDCSYVLLYDNQILQSFISLFFPEDSICECIGFTRPSCRKSGYFSLCLEKVCLILEQRGQETGCEAELVLLSDGQSRDALHTLDALFAEFWYAEHMMEIPSDILINRTEACSQAAHIKELPDGRFQIFPPGSSISSGSFCLFETNSYACLYDLFIEENARNQGFAMACLYFTGTYLQKKKIPSLKLQVSGSNLPAVLLYKKAGFQITETLSYYLY